MTELAGAGDDAVGGQGSFSPAVLASWLAARGVAARPLIVQGSPSGGGWSNETVFVTAGGLPLVVRLAPKGRSMFPTYDLSHQVRAMRLAAAGGLVVPEVLAEETDPAVLGRPFFVMRRIAGRVPADDDPPFTKAGFLFDASAAQQRRFHDGALDTIAAVHRLARPPFPTVGPQPADHLADCHRLAIWCEWTPPVLAELHDQLATDVPVAEPGACGLLWGDARPANMVLDDDLGIVALLDWELAASGPGELDVAWFIEMNRMRSVGTGIAPLPGFPDATATWQRWEQAVGRSARHIDWYGRYSAYRVAVFMQLYLAAMVHRGRLPAGHRLLADNAGVRRVRELLT